MSRNVSTIEVTSGNFHTLAAKEGILLVDWWASWCGPCRMFAPIFEEAAARHTDVTFGKVNTELQGELANAFRIRAIPTLMAFRDGVLLFEQAGALPGAALDELVARLREVDMEEVRRQVAKEQNEGSDARPQG